MPDTALQLTYCETGCRGTPSVLQTSPKLKSSPGASFLRAGLSRILQAHTCNRFFVNKGKKRKRRNPCFRPREVPDGCLGGGFHEGLAFLRVLPPGLLQQLC